jgi:hypothetical protein
MGVIEQTGNKLGGVKRKDDGIVAFHGMVLPHSHGLGKGEVYRNP